MGNISDAIGILARRLRSTATMDSVGAVARARLMEDIAALEDLADVVTSRGAAARLQRVHAALNRAGFPGPCRDVPERLDAFLATVSTVTIGEVPGPIQRDQVAAVLGGGGGACEPGSITITSRKVMGPDPAAAVPRVQAALADALAQAMPRWLACEVVGLPAEPAEHNPVGEG